MLYFIKDKLLVILIKPHEGTEYIVKFVALIFKVLQRDLKVIPHRCDMVFHLAKQSTNF